MPDSPSFVLLSQKLPANTLALKLLGRIVENVKQPTNGYRPEDPRPILATLGDEPIEVTDCDASVYHRSVKDANANAQLGHLFGLSVGTTQTDVQKLEGKKIITRILPQHRDAYDAILATHGQAIEKLLKQNGGVAYMVVGIKTILDGSVEVEHLRDQNIDGNATVPVSKAVTGGTQGVLNLGSTIDPKITGEKSVSVQWIARNQIVGELVFAIQYRVVALQREGRFWDQKLTAQLKALHVVEFQDGVYGEDDVENDAESREIIYEDDDSEHDSGDDDILMLAPLSRSLAMKSAVCGKPLSFRDGVSFFPCSIWFTLERAIVMR